MIIGLKQVVTCQEHRRSCLEDATRLVCEPRMRECSSASPGLSRGHVEDEPQVETTRCTEHSSHLSQPRWSWPVCGGWWWWWGSSWECHCVSVKQSFGHDLSGFQVTRWQSQARTVNHTSSTRSFGNESVFAVLFIADLICAPLSTCVTRKFVFFSTVMLAQCRDLISNHFSSSLFTLGC